MNATCAPGPSWYLPSIESLLSCDVDDASLRQQRLEFGVVERAPLMEQRRNDVGDEQQTEQDRAEPEGRERPPERRPAAGWT